VRTYTHIDAVVMRLSREAESGRAREKERKRQRASKGVNARERETENDSRLLPLDIECYTDSMRTIDRKKKRKREITLHLLCLSYKKFRRVKISRRAIDGAASV
jgi:hypothetical protein